MYLKNTLFHLGGYLHIKNFYIIKIAVIMPMILLLMQACGRRSSTQYQGYIEAEYIYVASPFSGYINRLFVERGDFVKSNTPLFELDSDEEDIALKNIEAQINQAQAYLADAQEGERQEELEMRKARIMQNEAKYDFSSYEYERRKNLVAEKAISESDFARYASQSKIDKASLYESRMALAVAQLGRRSNQIEALKASVKQAEAQKQNILWRKEQKLKTAPIDGIVFDTFFRHGELVAQGKPVLSLLSQEYVKVRFFVKANDVARIKQDSKVRCSIIAGDVKKYFDAKVSYISPQPEFTPTMIYSRECREKLVFMVEAKPESSNNVFLNPGQPVEVSLIE